MKKTIMFILKLIALVLIFLWVALVFFEYFRFNQNKDPMFCINEVEKKYDDGTTYTCTGLGYKMIKYNRECLVASQFGPFFIEEKTCNENK